MIGRRGGERKPGRSSANPTGTLTSPDLGHLSGGRGALEIVAMIYFAYGSNMNPSQMAERCPGYRSIGVARLSDHRLCFPRFSRARRSATAGFAPSPGDVVFGALYEVPPDDIAVLHYHEGYDPDGPPEFNRHAFSPITVLRQGGSGPVTAMTYVAIPDGTTALPSAAYMDTIMDGARYHRLPRAYLVVLQAVKTA